MTAQLVLFGRAMLWTSPACRCVLLAKALLPALDISAFEVDERLCELDFGEWEGRRWDEISRPDLDSWAADPRRFSPPGGETGNALIARVRAFWGDLGLHAGDHIVITHGGPLKVLQMIARDLEPDLLEAAPPYATIAVATLPRRR